MPRDLLEDQALLGWLMQLRQLRQLRQVVLG